MVKQLSSLLVDILKIWRSNLQKCAFTYGGILVVTEQKIINNVALEPMGEIV